MNKFLDKKILKTLFIVFNGGSETLLLKELNLNNFKLYRIMQLFV